ncbi:MAG TPA: lipoyl(octanoyl) transferase LipB [Baekduia sp.]|nr:lipoyl(octanoyl) transferase LipB [Baekduia sp.]
MDELLICRLGTVDYAAALELQERARTARKAGAIADTLLLLEHPPVYTRGRRSEPGELPMGTDWYEARGIEIVDVRRGGKVTYHGPGQLIAYPIVSVGDVLKFVRLVERSAVAALAAHGVTARGRADEGRDFTGVWVGEPGNERKIGSIGIHVSGQVTTHGLSVNVDTDLEPFNWIVPCGLPDAQMTSVAREGGDADIARFTDSFGGAFAAEMERNPVAIERSQLELALEPYLVA